MATAAAVEADAEAVTNIGDKSPSTVLGGVNASSDTDASDHFFQEDPLYDTGDEASESSIHESPSDSDVRSTTITLASRQQLELRDGVGSADTKIPSDSDVRSATITFASRCGDGSYLPLLLRHLYSEPLVLLWTIAAFISAYFIFLIFIFSPTMGLSTVFFHMPYPVLLAIAADRFVGPYGGFLVMHLATGWLASLLGSFKIDRGGKAAGFGLISLLLAMIGAVVLWLTPTDTVPISVAGLSILEGAAIFSWVAFVAKFVLHDALLSADHLGYIMLCYIVPYLVMSFFLLLLMTRFGLTGITIGATFLWCLMLFIAGLLGYELSVHAQCNQMMLSRRALELRDGLSSAAGRVRLPPLLLMTRQGVLMINPMN
uniref:Uncharacterized protein n=1 Tax=Oryza punctata TaxID=4537 RepID=A0A0E0JQT6_ORYPU